MQKKHKYLCEERFPQGWPIEEMIMSYCRNQRKALVREAKAAAELPDGETPRVRKRRGGRKKEVVENPEPGMLLLRSVVLNLSNIVSVLPETTLQSSTTPCAPEITSSVPKKRTLAESADQYSPNLEEEAAVDTPPTPEPKRKKMTFVPVKPVRLNSSSCPPPAVTPSFKVQAVLSPFLLTFLALVGLTLTTWRQS